MDQETKQFLLDLEERLTEKLSRKIEDEVGKAEQRLTTKIEDEVGGLAQMSQREFERIHKTLEQQGRNMQDHEKRLGRVEEVIGIPPQA